MTWQRNLTLAGLGIGAGVAAFAFLRPRTASAAPVPPADSIPEDTSAVWNNPGRFPTEDDVKGDLETNWGKVPRALRAYFMWIEEMTRLQGTARIYAVISVRESKGFNAAIHNKSDHEVGASRLAYTRYCERNPPLRYGVDSALAGSGGYFGALSPFFLWSGVVELKGNAPLLNAPPEIVELPRVAGWAAGVYMYRLNRYHDVRDVLDIKPGWAGIWLLGSGRGNKSYENARSNMAMDAESLEIDLSDTTTVAAEVDTRPYPGVRATWESMVGTLPTLKTPREPRPAKDLGVETPCAK